MKKQTRYCANDDKYVPAPTLPRWARELLGFILASAIIFPMLLLVAIGWRA